MTHFTLAVALRNSMFVCSSCCTVCQWDRCVLSRPAGNPYLAEGVGVMCVCVLMGVIGRLCGSFGISAVPSWYLPSWDWLTWVGPPDSSVCDRSHGDGETKRPEVFQGVDPDSGCAVCHNQTMPWNWTRYSWFCSMCPSACLCTRGHTPRVQRRAVHTCGSEGLWQWFNINTLSPRDYQADVTQ